MVDHNGNLYVFKEGYLRLSSEIFSLDNIEDNFIHLTNNAIQKNSDKYDNEKNLWSYDNFEEYLQSENLKGFREHSISEIHRIVRLTMQSVRKRLLNKNK